MCHGVPSGHAVSRLEADGALVAAHVGAVDDGGGAHLQLVGLERRRDGHRHE